MKKYEVYSQDNVRTLAGWTAERMQLGCTDTKCLTALGQMDISKLISGSVGKIGNRYTVSLNLFDTQNAKAENAVSEFGRSEDELIDLVQVAVRKLLGVEVGPSKVEEKVPEKATTALTVPSAGKAFTDPVTGMEFVFIKGGCYQMGDTFGDGGADEKPVHEVCVDDFYLGKYEVTVGEFRKFVDMTGYKMEAEKGGCYAPSTTYLEKPEKEMNAKMNASWRSPGFPINDKHPVVCVSWDVAVAYARWMEEISRKAYRLPTEAEWEYAARSGGKKYKYSWGNGEPSGNIADESLQRKDIVWPIWKGYDDGYAYTAPVGTYRPNEFGLYDMTGNVMEWCSDWFDENYYKTSPRNNPKGSDEGRLRVLRGGSWLDDPSWARVSNRVFSMGSTWFENSYSGFRLAFSASVVLQ